MTVDLLFFYLVIALVVGVIAGILVGHLADRRHARPSTYVRHWARFVAGSYSRELPTRDGLWPVLIPSEIASPAAIVPVRREPDGTLRYWDVAYTEWREVARWDGFWWSRPIPGLPRISPRWMPTEVAPLARVFDEERRRQETSA